jgi:nuclear transport factor 2 (NTF2) superfamily protein
MFVAAGAVAAHARSWGAAVMTETRPSVPPFTAETAAQQVQAAEDDVAGDWWRSYGNELWEFNPAGLIVCGEAPINDVRIEESERRIFGPRDHDDLAFPLR